MNKSDKKRICILIITLLNLEGYYLIRTGLDPGLC
jgi:hypothetical protein